MRRTKMDEDERQMQKEKIKIMEIIDIKFDRMIELLNEIRICQCRLEKDNN